MLKRFPPTIKNLEQGANVLNRQLAWTLGTEWKPPTIQRMRPFSHVFGAFSFRILHKTVRVLDDCGRNNLEESAKFRPSASGRTNLFFPNSTRSLFSSSPSNAFNCLKFDRLVIKIQQTNLSSGSLPPVMEVCA